MSPDLPRDAAEDLARRARDEIDTVEKKRALLFERHPRLARVARTGTNVLGEQSRQRVSLAAAGAAFWLMISAFPTVIAVATLYGLFVGPSHVATDLGRLANDVPGSLGSFLTQQIRSVAASDNRGLSLGLVGSVVVAIWSASGGIYHLDSAIRAAYELPPQRYFEARGRALVGALAVVVLVGLTAIAIPVALSRSSVIAAVLGIPVAIVAVTAGVGSLYRFSVGTGLGLRAVLPGALLSGIGTVVVIFGFGAYVATSTKYTVVYGAFAGTVIAMLAMYLAVRVVLVGAVLNTQLANASSERPSGNASREST